jgi:hypothetical protein
VFALLAWHCRHQAARNSTVSIERDEAPKQSRAQAAAASRPAQPDCTSGLMAEAVARVQQRRAEWQWVPAASIWLLPLLP